MLVNFLWTLLRSVSCFIHHQTPQVKWVANTVSCWLQDWDFICHTIELKTRRKGKTGEWKRKPHDLYPGKVKFSDKDVVASVWVCETCLGKLLVYPQPCLARRGHDLVMNRFNQLLAGTGGEGSRERFWSRLVSQAAWVRYPSASPAGRALWERGWGQVKSTVLFFLFTPILTRLSSHSFQYCLRHVG